MKLLLTILVFIGLKIKEILLFMFVRPFIFIKDIVNDNWADDVNTAAAVIMSFVYLFPVYYFLIPWSEGFALYKMIVISALLSFISFWLGGLVLFSLIAMFIGLFFQVIPEFIRDNWEEATKKVEKMLKKDKDEQT